MTKKRSKRQYRIRNWRDYNKALVERGSLTLWIGEEVLAAWRDGERTGKRGAPRAYTDTVILCMATLEEVYHLPLRATEGLTRSVVRLLGVELSVPDYTTLCRRRKALEVELPRRPRGEPLHVVVNSTGVKVFGEGEWKVRQHGYSKRRTWRKLHLGVDEATGEFVAVVVTTNSFKDSQLLPDLLEQVGDEIAQVSADGAYDSRNCYDAIRERGARAAIPPRKRARIWQHGNTKRERHIRDENLRAIRRGGRGRWKRESGYHRRSLAEAAVFRVKTIFGGRVGARSFEGQAAQMLVRCAALNRMTHVGMPDSYAVAA
ncbi:MAG: IS5 family transposase [Acidobacteria bacterium]|nr:IS5 family transposase [Acidobacteriota bacterium]